MSGRNTKLRAATHQQRPDSQVTPSVAGGSSPPCGSTSPRPDAQVNVTDTAALKLELLTCLRQDIAEIFITELRAALGDDLSTIRADLQAVKTQLANDKATADAELASLKGTVGEVEVSLSSCTDDIVDLKCKYERLSSEFSKLENKCEDLESRSRRQNIRIVGVSEDTVVNTTAVAALLKDVLKLDKEPLLDRAHRSAQPRPRPDERPRPIIARFHYYTDCADVLRRAREGQRFGAGNVRISIFPDHTAKVARARAAFNEVRKHLRGVEGVRYGLFYPARLRITYGGVEKDFVSADDAKAYVEKMNSG